MNFSFILEHNQNVPLISRSKSKLDMLSHHPGTGTWTSRSRKKIRLQIQACPFSYYVIDGGGVTGGRTIKQGWSKEQKTFNHTHMSWNSALRLLERGDVVAVSEVTGSH